MQPILNASKLILITGANGQLGKCFAAVANKYPNFNFIFTSRDVLDITKEAAVADFFEQNNISAVVNCAAYTAVDKAEIEKEIAFLNNATAVGFLAENCAKLSIPFIHISTDYVFDGTATTPYLPVDKTNPVNYYGETKLAGELLALQKNPQSLIIRTAWVYSEFGNNFVKTMLRLMGDRESIDVVADQYGAPTYAMDLAEAIMGIINDSNFSSGIYHYSNVGKITWFNFASKIAELSKSTCTVNPITSAEFPTPAKRPSFSCLDTSSFATSFNVSIRNWDIALAECMAKL
jgi:dTDP-4-dehydrorhamnose reductase